MSFAIREKQIDKLQGGQTMKKMFAIVGILALAAVIAVPVYSLAREKLAYSAGARPFRRFVRAGTR